MQTRNLEQSSTWVSLAP